MSIPSFFAHIAHLFHKEAPKVAELLQPEIDLAQSLIKKYAAVDLTMAAGVALSVVSANTPFAPAMSAVGVALKSSLQKQGIDAVDEEVTMLSQALIKSQAVTVNTAVAAGTVPPPPITPPAEVTPPPGA